MYATPGNVRGVSLRDIYDQRKADEEFKNLMRSTERGADVKAFAQGLMAGSALPIILTSAPMISQISSAHQGEVTRAHLAHWLRKKGVPKSRAHQAAAGAYRFMQMQAPGGDVEAALRQSKGTGWVVDQKNLKGHVYSSKKDALKGVEQLLVSKKGISRKDAKQHAKFMLADDVIKKVKGKKRGTSLSDMLLSPRESKRILEEARTMFEASGKAAPTFSRTARKMAPRLLVQSAPAIATLGLVTGIGNVLRTRRQREKAQDIRGRLRAARSY
jgi:hypothetical protein